MPSLLQFIEKLRGKPDHERHLWTLGLSITSTLVVALLWVTSLSISLSAKPVVAVEPTPSPFGQVASVAAVNMGAVKDGFIAVIGDLINLF